MNDILIGNRYGRLVVLEEAEERYHGRRMYLCQCDCGNQKIVQAYSLKSGNTKSCGCLKKGLQSSMFQDISGEKYGNLTVVECTGKKKDGSYIWKCSCDCGGETTASSRDLRRGHKRSCGCLNINKGDHRRADLIGQTFGMLKVIKQIDKRNKFGGLQWECICDCGRTVIVNSHALLCGNTKSCGNHHNPPINHIVRARKIFESATGREILKGQRLVFLDGDTNNCEISNLYILDKKAYDRFRWLNKKSGDKNVALSAIKTIELEMLIDDLEI